ncbi:hypothetical protein J3E72DRAFT_241868 [Bipolaris maydis]|nr:hypothetical protein BM1_08225 [Bipolaris maydis]KAJ5021368.1 hypothetical protein J3E73DRAFT_385947 [Bipolaris maydis]KAJ5061360.1 hypothetical protein J3E74DRAFT_270212 [Bipolaris maydis]KAJ6198490.1 hypothetical protein J3E72DRAFT_241868 [Bipolaris maydis]KAJ6271846.1 hypothetical protein PSV08DRAFT_360965 [Bipolaris maydis]
MDNRAIRLNPNTRRNLFAAHTTQQQPPTSRRQNQNAPSVRPDSREIQQDIFTQPVEDEMVERDAQGDYIIHAPTPVYKNMGTASIGPEGDEEGENENELIEMYGKPNVHWAAAGIEDEIRIALKSSLRKKVASLEDDRWMFQAESESKK